MRKIMIAVTASAAVVAAAATPAFGQADVNARSIAATCANCHGTGGVAVGGSAVPGLAGQSKEELVRKLTAYKEGKLAGTIMPQLAKGYTEAQIDQMAGWFAARKSK